MHATMARMIAQLLLIGDTDPAAVIARVKPLALELSEDRSWLPESAYACDAAQGVGITMFHIEPDDLLTVETVAWLPGRHLAPHNHKTWGVVVGLDGAERNLGWKRLDDGTIPGHAELAVERETVVRRGDVIGLMPEDIHSVYNDGDRVSISLHIYGRNLATVDREQFDPLARTVRPCPKRLRRDA